MRHYPECLEPLKRAGITERDALALRRIAMQLHHWHELECGIDAGGVERDEVTGKCTWYNSRTGTRSPCADRETGALKRLGKIMAGYKRSALSFYVQSDPRGASLYILRAGDVPKGEDVSAYYSRGLAVYK